MISIIIPTLGQREPELIRLLDSLVKQTYKEIELIVVSQDNHEFIEETLKKYPLTYKHIKVEEKGLSKARNKAMPFINGKLVTFSDDDCWYPADGLEKVIKTFEDHPANDVICFKIHDPLQKTDYKSYPIKSNGNINGIDFLRKSSIEIFARSLCFKEGHIRFDERFGLGGKYNSGEENIILNDLKKSGFRIAFEPSVVVYHRKREKEVASNMDIIKKGPLFIRIFGYPIGITLFHMFYLKKWRSIHRPLASYKSSIQEIKEYKTFDKN